MKKWIALLLSVAMVLCLAACGGGTSGDNGSGTNTQDQNTAAPIALTLWGAEEDQPLLVELTEKFKAAYPDQQFNIQIGVQSESNARDTVLTDVEAAADVFAFASDQLDTLIAGNALLDLSSMDAALQAYAKKSVADVIAANGEGSVAAASRGGTLYAFPFGGGNNFYLYYDSTKISPEQAESWDTMLDAAQAAGSKVGMTLSSGWYNAGFFYGAGFTTGLNSDGTTSIDWNGTSSKGISGVDVVKGMQKIAAHPGFLPVADGDVSNQIASGNVCAVVTGSWDDGACQTAFGDGYSASKLPTFECAGQQIQQGCSSGYKLMGVNAFSKNAGWAVLLAEFLTNEESQTARFQARQLAPTNNVAASADEVQSNVAIAASAAQDAAGGVVQLVGDKYWDPTKSFGEQIAQGTIAADDAAIQSALDALVAGVTAPLG